MDDFIFGERWNPGVRAALRLVEEIPRRDQEATLDYLARSGLPLDGVLLALLEQSEDCVKLIGLDGRLDYMNCNGKRLMQIDDFGAVHGAQWSLLWPEAVRDRVDGALEAAAAGRTSRFVGDCPTARGVMRRWEVMVAPIQDRTGNVLAFVSCSRALPPAEGSIAA